MDAREIQISAISGLNHVLFCSPLNISIFHNSFFVGCIFNLEDGGNMSLQNDGELTADCSVLYPRRENSSKANVIDGTCSSLGDVGYIRS
jgi:hypothetical protein